MPAVKSRTATGSSREVVDQVNDLISEHRLRPGERLPSIRDLAAQFGVRTGVVRDALITAQSRGLIKVLPRLGAIVQSNDHTVAALPPAKTMPGELSELLGEEDQNLFHVLDTREALELATVARASRRRELPDLFTLRQLLEEMVSIPVTEVSPEYVELDIRFHLEIGRLSGNLVMTSLLEVLLRELKPHLARIRWSRERRQATNDSHARIYSALVAGDGEKAEAEMRDHIRTAFNSLLDELRHPPKMNDRQG
jgi:GntR family transcriptional repressor for pyruvate dehydrogenase complex